SPAVDTLSADVVRLPVRPSRGNFFEAGVSKALARVVRLDVSYFVRAMNNFADDDLLLNSGISFPIAFRHATIRGAEIRLDVTHWKTLAGSVSYAYMRGVGELPVTGGLLLGDEASTLLTSTGAFAVTQDQRQTIRSPASWQLSPSAWIALAASYGSGLPFEFVGDRNDAVEQ